MKEVHWAFNKEGRGGGERGVAGVLGGSLKRQLTYYIRVSKTYIGNVIIHIQIGLSRMRGEGGKVGRGAEGGRGAR